MKRYIPLALLSCALLAVVPAQAHGPARFGGGYGHHHGHHGYGHGRWIGPVLGAALVGTAVYAATYPRMAYSAPVVVSPPVVVDPSRVAYFCASYQQYYPNVATCPVPWQVVPY
jgi:hypothetical protein